MWKNQEEIYKEKYPDLFCDYLISFNFGEGWEPIVTRLMDALREENKKHPDAPMHVVQVKEKFGGIRFYLDIYTYDLEETIRAAEKESLETCEMCGTKENVTTEGGWLKTLCKQCRKTKYQ